MSKEHNNKDLDNPEVQKELRQAALAKREEKTRELIGQHLTNDVVSKMRLSARIKVQFGNKPSDLIGVLKIDCNGVASWSVEQRFGFPYTEIQDRDVRRIVWSGLASTDEDDQLRILIIDQQHTFAASIRVPINQPAGA